MEYLVDGYAGTINFGATGVEEVLQNVRTILTTPKFSVPLDREFGLDAAMVDRPIIPVAEGILIAEVFRAIRKYEPRAKVKKVEFVQIDLEAMDGKMVPRVTVEVIL